MELKFEVGDHVVSENSKGIRFYHHVIVISTHGDGSITIMDYFAATMGKKISIQRRIPFILQFFIQQ